MNGDNGILEEYEKALDGFSLQELKKICALSFHKFIINKKSICNYVLICDKCHYVEMDRVYKDGNYCVACTKCNLRGLCNNCSDSSDLSGYYFNETYDENRYICLQCSENLCGICQKSIFFDHTGCEDAIKPLLYMPDDICK